MAVALESPSAVMLPVESVQFVRELYPRLREDDAAIERYRAALDRLPPIIVARGRVLVDGFHRWQAHRREQAETIAAVDLGDLADIEILKESVRRNSGHGRQLDTRDKKRMADQLWRQGVRDESELADLLSITPKTCAEYVRSAKRDERQAQKESAWDRWLNCESYRQIGAALDVDHQTVAAWCGEFSNQLGNSPPDSRQHFDVWPFAQSDDDAGAASFFGRMPPQVVENLLWRYTEPGQIVVDPFAGSGTTIDVAKRMGRRVWASDLYPSTPMLPIHQHDIASGWSPSAPGRAELIVLDPPYWKQAAGRYSSDERDLGNQTLDEFMASWRAVVAACMPHLGSGGRLAFIVSPTHDGERVVDHALEMWFTCRDQGLAVERRYIVPYQTQQATGQQVEWAREHRVDLKLYRDLVVMRT